MEHKIGLVFDGGGGKGAYQIGMWKALRETGLYKYVTDVAGTSVGGLNAALFCKGDLEDAEKIWLDEISTVDIPTIQMDVDKLINKHLGKMEFFDTSPINCYITVHNASNSDDLERIEYTNSSITKFCRGKAEYLNIRFLPSDERNDFFRSNTINKLWKLATEDINEVFKRSKQNALLATSALPFFCLPVLMGDNMYSDGGQVDNSPAYALLEAAKCDTIIVVHLKADALSAKKARRFELDYKRNPDVTVLEVFPSEDTGGFINGTINFNSEHAARLMNLGYRDTIEPFKAILKNWKKEFISTTKDIDFELIEEMPSEDKYRLYNECEFLIKGNYAKLNFLNEEGFGKTIWRVIAGSGRRAKQKIIKNTIDLQVKMNKILICLDDEILNLRQTNRLLFKASLNIYDVLLGQHEDFMCMTEILSGMIDRMKYTDDFLAQKYPDYKKWNASDTQKRLDDLKISIMARVNSLNEEYKRLYDVQQKELEALENKRKQASTRKFLRINPNEAVILTDSSSETFPVDNTKFCQSWYAFKDQNSVEKLLTNDVSAVIIPEGFTNIKKYKITGVRTVTPADYYMFLWFENKPLNERRGKCVCMIDYYDGYCYLHVYKVNAEGTEYEQLSTDERTAYASYFETTMSRRIRRALGGYYYADMLFYRTFKTIDVEFDEALDKIKEFSIQLVDSNWENNFNKYDSELFIKLADRFIDRH